MNHWLHRLAVFAACATLCLIAAGALVTSNEAGLSVPDWPLSYGSLTPPWEGNIRYEHGHRLAAMLVGLSTICLTIWLWRSEERRWVRRLGLAALAAVVAQGLLGGITVLFFLPRPVSIAHACLAQTFFCLTLTLATVTGAKWKRAQPRPPSIVAISRLSVLTTAAVFVQLALGAAVRHNALGIIPHLIGAALVAVLAIVVVQRVRRHSAQPWRGAAIRFCAVAVVQLLLGACAYYARLITRDAPQPLPIMVWATVAHVVTGALTLAAAWKLTLETHREISRRPEERLQSEPSVGASAVIAT